MLSGILSSSISIQGKYDRNEWWQIHHAETSGPISSRASETLSPVPIGIQVHEFQTRDSKIFFRLISVTLTGPIEGPRETYYLTR